MAWTKVVKTAVDINGTTPLVITNSPAAQPNDLLYAFVATASDTSVITGPSGWTKIGSVVLSAASQLTLWRKVAGAAEPTTYSWSDTFGGLFSITFFQLTGGDILSPEDVAVSTNAASSGTSGTALGVTTLTDGCMILAGWTEVGSSNAITVDASMTQESTLASSGLPAASAAGSLTQGTKGATGNKVATAAAGPDWYAILVAVRPSQDVAVRNSSGAAGASSTNFVMNVPSGVVDGDLMVAHVRQQSGFTISPPAGWNTGVLGGTNSGMYWRLASSEPASYTWTSTGTGTWSGIIDAFYNVDQVTPIDVASQTTNATIASVTWTSITSITDRALNLAVSMEIDGTDTIVPPSGYVPRSSQAPGNGHLRSSWFIKTPAGAIAPTSTDTDGTPNWRTFNTAIRKGVPPAAPSGALVLPIAFPYLLLPWSQWPLVRQPNETTLTVITAVDNPVTEDGVGTESVVVIAIPASVDAGVGTESVITTGAPTATDSGVGTETTVTVVYWFVTEDGLGSESVVTTGSVTATESGAGAEAHSVVAVVGTSENGAGSEANSTLAIIGLTDSGSGTETVVQTASIVGTDSGAGSETVTTTGAPTAADSGTGTEAFSLTVLLTITDSGVGTESVVYVQLTLATDSGAGTESVSTTGTIPAADSGAGTEAHAVTAQVTTTDSGAGSESAFAAVPGFFVSSDSGAGTETTVTTAAVPITDTASGTESFTVTAVMNATETGTGTESLSILVLQTATNTGVGTETVITTGAPTATDSGAGSESTSIGIPASLSVSDSGQGSESFVVAGAGVISGTGFGHYTYREPHLPAFFHGREKPFGLGMPELLEDMYRWGDDGGQGTESTVVTATVTMYDAGKGVENFTSSSQPVWDGGRGRERARVRKVEDLDSELRTVIFLAQSGAITETELNILLLDHALRTLRS
jgi:hypothetical protein